LNPETLPLWCGAACCADTGVQVNHEDLADSIWVNPGEIAGNGIDDDGNGFIDDVCKYIAAWQFVLGHQQHR
jgi:hypothetical protein